VWAGSIMGIAVTAMKPPGLVMKPAGRVRSCEGLSMARSSPASLRVDLAVRMRSSVRSGSRSLGEKVWELEEVMTSWRMLMGSIVSLSISAASSVPVMEVFLSERKEFRVARARSISLDCFMLSVVMAKEDRMALSGLPRACSACSSLFITVGSFSNPGREEVVSRRT